MKKISGICLWLFIAMNCSSIQSADQNDRVKVQDLHDQRILVDKIAAIVYGPERTYVICESELNRIGIDGVRPTREALVTEELIYQDALKHHATREEDADRYIRTIKENNKITDQDVDKIFENAGLTPSEGRLKLQKMAAKQTMISIKVTSRIDIAYSDVEREYARDPRYEDARYEIEIAFVPFFSNDPLKQEEQHNYLLDQIQRQEVDVMWGCPLWVNESDLADDKKFITAMTVGSISQPQRVSNGFELYRLKNKKERRLITLEERYRELVDRLRQPKFQETFDAYIDELYKTASVAYVDQKN